MSEGRKKVVHEQGPFRVVRCGDGYYRIESDTTALSLAQLADLRGALNIAYISERKRLGQENPDAKNRVPSRHPSAPENEDGIHVDDLTF